MIYTKISRLMPKKYRNFIKLYLNYAGFNIPAEKYAGFSVLYGILLGAVLFFASFFITDKSPILIGFSGFVLFEVFSHAILILAADKRAKLTDEVLPDALRLMSSNIKSGLTPDRALMLSARPEFGPLEKEIRKAAKKTLSGELIEEAIHSMSKNINSQALKKTIGLLSESMRQGGNLAQLLDGLADNIRQSKILKKEVKAYVMMYVIFIFFAAGIGAPLLYAISSFLVKTMTEIGGEINIEDSYTTETKFMNFKGVDIDESFLGTYSLLSISITCLFGGMLIGLVQEGSEKSGLKYGPVLLLVSLSVYFISKIMIARIFGSIIG